MLHEFIATNREEIIRRCRAKVMTRSVPAPTEAEIDRGVPVFLDLLAEALHPGPKSSPEIDGSSIQRGEHPAFHEFTVSQVVHDCSDICQAVTELAADMNAPLGPDDFRNLSRCLDDAVAGAVTEYRLGRHQPIVDGGATRESERLGFLAHELRNLINTAIVAFEVLKTGNIGVAGRTGNVLYRSLLGLRALISRSLAEVRLTQGVQNRQPFLVSGFIGEITPAATLEAHARDIGLVVVQGEEALAIEADRQVLAAVVGNLLQNAFKFTRPRTTVTLRIRASTERVLIEIQDECGGLPNGNANEMFLPFEQRSADRSGLGLGLAFSRWGVEANNGRIYARNLPGEGCVFTVDLPRVPVPAGTIVESRSSKRQKVET